MSDNWLTFAEDTVFWIRASILEILFIYHINNGAIRVYFIMCTVLGATIYFFTIGKITIYFSVRIIFLIRCLLYWGIYIIIYPIRVIFHFIIKVTLFIVSKTIIPVVETVKKQSLNSYSKKRASHILIQSKKGFVYDQI